MTGATGPEPHNYRDSWKPMWVVHEGRVIPMSEWQAATGISTRMINFRLHVLGWSEADAMTKPPLTPWRADAGLEPTPRAPSRASSPPSD